MNGLAQGTPDLCPGADRLLPLLAEPQKSTPDSHGSLPSGVKLAEEDSKANATGPITAGGLRGVTGMATRPEESVRPGPQPQVRDADRGGGLRTPTQTGDTSPSSPVYSGHSWQHVPTPASGSQEDAPQARLPPLAPSGTARALEPAEDEPSACGR